MQRYRVLEQEVFDSDDGLQMLLGRAHSLREKCYCLCDSDEKLPLYVARRNDVYVLARWPGTGALHTPDCDHYEAPDFLTGLGEVRGSAIIEDEDSGNTNLKFGFPLSRGPARAAPSALTNDKPVVKTNGKKLSMRGLLHFLWDRGHLTHWHPKMGGKRNWYVVRRALMSAAVNCRNGGNNFGQSLFIPEMFRLEERDEILQRRESQLLPVKSSRDKIMVVIAEVKSIEGARFGEKVVLKHLPDWPFMLDADMARRFHSRFKVEQELWNADDRKGHLILAGTFSVSPSGFPDLLEVALMPVTEEWLPYETLDERRLVEKAVSKRRHFVKGMRVNLASDVPIASVSFTDTGRLATAVYLPPNRVDPAYDEALAALMKTPGIEHLVWRPGEDLPAPVRRQTRNSPQSNLTI